MVRPVSTTGGMTKGRDVPVTSSEQMIHRLHALPAMAALHDAAARLPGPIYLVGGAVRDLALGEAASDLDVVTTAPLDLAAAQLAEALRVRAIPLGRPPKRIYRFAPHGLIIDLAPAEGGSLEQDLARRDLTINAMALDLTAGSEADRLFDPYGGLSDLEHRTARFVSEKAVLDDPLRLLRFFRFAATLGLRPDPASLTWVARHAPLITRSAGERVRTELIKLLAAPRSHPFVRLMLDHGLLEVLIPELVPLRLCDQNEFHHLPVLGHTLLALDQLEGILERPEVWLPGFAEPIQSDLLGTVRGALLKLAMLLHDIGKARTLSTDATGGIHFYRHEVVGEKMAAAVTERLRMSRVEDTFVRGLVRQHLHPWHLFESERRGTLKQKGVLRFLARVGDRLAPLLVHALADGLATQGPKVQAGRPELKDLAAFFHRLLKEQAVQRQERPRLLSGHEIMRAFGLAPSPVVGRLLRAIGEAQALGRIENREQALRLAEETLTRESGRDGQS